MDHLDPPSKYTKASQFEIPKMGAKVPYFSCTRVNSTTFVIAENDKYAEHPFIYVKIYETIVVLSDTGCGGCADASNPSESALRHFIETSPIDVNGRRPLNPCQEDGKPSKKYLVICTHCHYDHILGLSQFTDADPGILASLRGKSFVEDNLSEHSLCTFLGLPTPDYTVSYWAEDYEKVSFSGVSLGLQIIATPGHTPDELAWYDEQERHLYVGDSFYERMAKDKSYEQAIIFPKEGNIVDYMDSLEKLLVFVDEKNKELDKSSVKIGCGHVTSSVEGKEILLAVQTYFQDVLAGRVQIMQVSERRGEEIVLWQDDGEPRFSLSAPKRLIVDARKHYTLAVPEE